MFENVNVSEVFVKHCHCCPLWKDYTRPVNFVSLNFSSSIFNLVPYVQDKLFVLEVLLDLINNLLTDISKDVIGQDAHEGDTEDLEEERELGTGGQEAGQPETDVVLGE